MAEKLKFAKPLMCTKNEWRRKNFIALVNYLSYT